MMSEDLPPWAKKLLDELEAQKNELVVQKLMTAALVNQLEGQQAEMKKELQSQITTLQEQVAAQDKLLHPPNVICTPALRDPLTVAMSFMMTPQRFRNCCKFTAEVFNQAVFLEGRLACGVVNRSDISWSMPIVGSKVNGLRLCNIHSISVQHVTKLESLRENWMCGLDGNSPFLVKVAIKDCPNLRSIGRGPLSQCSVLEEVQFCNLPVLTYLPGDFLWACPKLKKVQIEDLPQLEHVSFKCFAKCALESLSFHNFPRLRTIGNDFASHCPTLQHLVFRNLPSLEKIGDRFFYRAGVSEIKVEDLPLLSSLGENGFAQCTKLESATFKDLPRLEQVGYYDRRLLSGSNAKELRLDNLPLLNWAPSADMMSQLKTLEVINSPKPSSLIYQHHPKRMEELKGTPWNTGGGKTSE